MGIENEALSEFIAECEEILARVSGNLQSLEKGSFNQETLTGLYRDMHTMKGSAQLFGFLQIGKLAHAMEASLDPIRKLNCAVDPRLVDACFKVLDLISKMVKEIPKSQSDQGFSPEMETALPELVEASTAQFGASILVPNEPVADFTTDQKPSPSANKTQAQEVRAATPPVMVSTPVPPPAVQTESEHKVVSTSHFTSATSATTATPVAPQSEQPGATVQAIGAVESTIRVQVSLLDRLMNLVGELVLLRNQVLQYQSKTEEQEFHNLSKGLDVVTTDLQGEVMKTRMQPIGSVVSKFQRVVRDLAKDLGKRIDLTLQGQETELDKTLLEAIKDPLTHIVRNSCDHGIEQPDERKKAGKPETGHCLIRAFHEGGQVVIEISDDGKGLDREKLIAKALEKNLIAPEKANKMPDRDVYNLIFLPGFSTAKQVTAVSGRGVGMDVVKTNIEKIGGTVEIQSALGKGTTMRLKIPLTLAIVPAMLVRCGKERFAIPQVKLVELVRVEEGDAKSKVEYLQGRPMYRLRGALLPLVELWEVLGDPKLKVDRTKSGETQIVVLNGEGSYFGLIVDEILDKADIVVKPLSSFLKCLSVFSGATIMGDGSISLILDVMGIAETAKLDTKRRTDDIFSDAAAEKKANLTDSQEYLLISVKDHGTHAIPLCLVHRLEEFDRASVELSGEQKVVRYRDSILPLLDLDKCLSYKPKPTTPGNSTVGSPQLDRDKVSVVVVSRSQRLYGILVEDILDVVTIDEAIDDAIRDRPGILGNLVYSEEIIAVVDALGVIEIESDRMRQGGASTRTLGVVPGSSRDRLEEIKTRTREQKSKKVRILYAEDVAFFRKQVAKVLNAEGMEVTACEDGQKALDLLESSEKDEFNLILSDIEMPRLNGYQFAREVRKRDRFKSVPMIALTTRFRDRDIKEGKEAGFDLYLEKLNPEKLIRGIDEVMSESRETRLAREAPATPVAPSLPTEEVVES